LKNNNLFKDISYFYEIQNTSIMKEADELKKIVKEKYSNIAIQSNQTSAGCGCGCAPEEVVDYSVLSEDYRQLKGYIPEADLGLGCGLPTKHAFIRPGDTVVDLGSGAGNDCFIARKETGDSGRVIGVDMAGPMIKKAKENAENLGYQNVEFLLGEIEQIPLPADSTDIVVSNCVFNLVPDKSRAFSETYRILRPGGHFSISDVVSDGRIPEKLLREAELYAGCISGAMEEIEYLDVIRSSGFIDIQVMQKNKIEVPANILEKYDGDGEFLKSDADIYSVTVFAKKPYS
jgi:SAM-dependent methyltransferase